MATVIAKTEQQAQARSPARLLTWLAGGAAALVVMLAFGWLTLQCQPFIIDDAFISFHYAENLVRGAGLVYNPGERVEGYTNFLWVIGIAAVHALGGESLAGAKVLGVAANVGTLAVVTRAAARWWPRPAFPGVALLPALLLAVNFGFVLWGVGGLETALFTCLVTAGLLRLVWESGDGAPDATPAARIFDFRFSILDFGYARCVQARPRTRPADGAKIENRKSKIENSPFPWAAVLFALATLARPDGVVLFAGGMLGWAAWALRHHSLRPRLLGRWLAGGGVYGAIVGAHYLFRYTYYGDWVPNTTYIKVPAAGFEVHWQALVTWLRPWGLVDPSILAPLTPLLPGLPPWWTWAVSLLATPTVLLVAVGLLASRRAGWAWVLGAAGGLWLIYLARVYDDWMPGWRYYVPLVPATTLLLAAGFNRLAAAARSVPGRAGRWLAGAALGGILAGMALLSLGEARSEFPVVAGHADIQAHYRAAGEYLRAHAAPGATLAVIDAGAIPYYAGLFTIDYGGLADAHMARVPLQPVTLDKGDGVIRHYLLRADPAYLLGRRPDFVQLGGHIRPDGHWLGHLPELVLVYDAMRAAGSYDLAHPVLVDDPVQLILVRRTDAAWHP